MKKTFAVVLGVLLICGFSTRLVASETPPDPKFNSSVEWYKCEIGMVKYQQGLEEKESKLQCLKNDKVNTGNIEMALVPRARGGTTVYYYPVMNKDVYQYFMDKDYSFQCAPSKEGEKGFLAAYGIKAGSFDKYMISPPEMSQYEGRNWVDDEYGKKGLVVNQAASVGAFSNESCGESMCQFYSKETNMRFGLFKIACGSKGSINVGGDSGSSEDKGLKGLKGLFKKK